MACFLVPAAEAIVVTAVAVAVKKKEQKIQAPQLEGASTPAFDGEEKKFTWSKKLSLLAKLLWGGIVLLAFEHVWHGEVIAVPPFLTAMSNAEDTQVMLHEMATIGTSMAALVTGIWGAICIVADTKFKAIKAKLSKEK
jgi:hypothetical protein